MNETTNHIETTLRYLFEIYFDRCLGSIEKEDEKLAKLIRFLLSAEDSTEVDKQDLTKLQEMREAVFGIYLRRRTDKMIQGAESMVYRYAIWRLRRYLGEHEAEI